jgi:hypothetical protein
MNIENIFNKKTDPLLRKGVVGGSFCVKCKTKTSAVQHSSKLCYDCWRKSKIATNGCGFEKFKKYQ